jgi:DNA-binding CsgD family transcriptional regulator
LIEGKTNAEIAVILGMRETTVKTHVTSIFSRAAVENRAAALRWGLEVLSRPELVVPMQQTVTAHFAEE